MSYESAARQQMRHKWWLRAVGILACVVVFITVYALVLPAITMEGTPTCGLEEHTHDAECYDADGVLTCTLDEHVHDSACYAEDDAELAEPDAEPANADPADPADETDDAEDAEPVLAAPVLRAPLLGAGGSSSIAPSGKVEAANEWQIVSGEYVGNSTAEKIISSDGLVRIQKNVIPTDTENEFLVYLSMDAKEQSMSYFEYAEYNALTSNSSHSYKPGDIISMPGGSDVDVSPTTHYAKSATFTIYDENDEPMVENLTIYWSKGNNVTFGIKLESGPNAGQYLLVGVTVRQNTHNDIKLGEAAKILKEEMINSIKVDRVVDNMGDYISYDSLVGADGTVTETATGVQWNPTLKSGLDPVVETETIDGKTYTSNWYLNVAELMYKVRLNVDQSGFESCADTIDNKSASPKYATNSGATLYYGDGKSIDFPVPYVRGLLYDIIGSKVDKYSGAALPNVEFTVTDQNGESQTVTTDENGKFSVVGLPWGEYTVVESGSLPGYDVDTHEATAKLCYTTDKESLIISSANDTHMMANNGSDFEYKDTFIQPTIVLVKQDFSGNPLNGAEFTVTGPNDFSESGVSMAEGSENYSKILVIEKAEPGTYNVQETKAPAGYETAEGFDITVPSDGSDISVTPGSKSVSKIDKSENTDGSHTYTIYIVNNPGIELPETGGMGTVIFTVSGLTLMAAAMLLLSKQRKRFDA